MQMDNYYIACEQVVFETRTYTNEYQKFLHIKEFLNIHNKAIDKDTIYTIIMNDKQFLHVKTL